MQIEGLTYKNIYIWKTLEVSTYIDKVVLLDIVYPMYYINIDRDTCITPQNLILAKYYISVLFLNNNIT